MSLFADRREAGRRLAERLAPLAGESPVVLALPRGGVEVAYEVAAALRAPLDIVVARKLGAPGDPELAIGAVVEGDHPEAVLNAELVSALGVTQAYLHSEVDRQLQEIARRQRAYRGAAPRSRSRGGP